MNLMTLESIQISVLMVSVKGLAAHWEMWMFAQGGMSNMDVLKNSYD